MPLALLSALLYVLSIGTDHGFDGTIESICYETHMKPIIDAC